MSLSPLSESPLKARLFSIEMMVALAIFISGGSGIWFGVVAKVDASDQEIGEIKTMQKTQGEDIQTIKISNAVILQRLTEAERRDKERAEQTQRILEILQNEKMQ